MGTRVESDCQTLPAVWLPQVTLPPHLRNGGHGSTSLTEQSEETGSQAYGTHSLSNVVITTSSSPSPTLTSRNPVRQSSFRVLRGLGLMALLRLTPSLEAGGAFTHTHSSPHLTCSLSSLKRAHALPQPLAEAQCCSPWPMHQSRVSHL